MSLLGLFFFITLKKIMDRNEVDLKIVTRRGMHSEWMVTLLCLYTGSHLTMAFSSQYALESPQNTEGMPPSAGLHTKALKRHWKTQLRTQWHSSPSFLMNKYQSPTTIIMTNSCSVAQLT